LPIAQPELARIVLLYAGAQTVGSCADACAGLRAICADVWRELEPALRSPRAVELLMARATPLRALHLDLPCAPARNVALCARYVQSAGAPLLSIRLDARTMRRGSSEDRLAVLRLALRMLAQAGALEASGPPLLLRAAAPAAVPALRELEERLSAEDSHVFAAVEAFKARLPLALTPVIGCVDGLLAVAELLDAPARRRLRLRLLNCLLPFCPSESRAVVCKYWCRNAGYCSWGCACRYLHPPAGLIPAAGIKKPLTYPPLARYQREAEEQCI